MAIPTAVPLQPTQAQLDAMQPGANQSNTSQVVTAGVKGQNATPNQIAANNRGRIRQQGMNFSAFHPPIVTGGRTVTVSPVGPASQPGTVNLNSLASVKAANSKSSQQAKLFGS